MPNWDNVHGGATFKWDIIRRAQKKMVSSTAKKGFNYRENILNEHTPSANNIPPTQGQKGKTDPIYIYSYLRVYIFDSTFSCPKTYLSAGTFRIGKYDICVSSFFGPLLFGGKVR